MATQTRSYVERLLDLVDRYNLCHVKTLHYEDKKGVLEWLGSNGEDFTFRHDEDTIEVVNRYLTVRKLGNVGMAGIFEEPQLEGKDRLVVDVKRNNGSTTTARCEYDAVVLFTVIPCDVVRAPYCQEISKLIRDAQTTIKDTDRGPLFPTLAKCPTQIFKPKSQQERPVIDGFLPSSYNTVKKTRSQAETVDNFGRSYQPLQPTAEVSPWSIYANVAEHGGDCEFDLEELMRTPNKVLGRGGFGVTVALNDHLVAKTNLFPETVNWSVPFIDQEFSRYAHVASQTEEVMLGVSMQHPNILRTFGGFWCEVPGYQLGGRAVIIMERALCSLQEFAWRIGDSSFVPAVELDTLRGLDYLHSRAVQHRDFTFRNVLVCHQPGRKPLPFAFKISDFGTACNFSTPDQPRGNRTNMAPEVLWCLNSATGSDIFSWYCVMWELHSGTPLVSFKRRDGAGGYCKETYAENLSKLVGVYSPENHETLELGYMKSMKARELHVKYGAVRPTAQEILKRLRTAGRDVSDEDFVSMGALCITLFPQERWSPSRLLNLRRYRRLSRDVSEARLPFHRIPSSVRLGEYRPTDVIVSDECVPEKLLAELVAEGSNARSSCEVIKPDQKVYYGIDLFRLAPGLIQPYDWYAKKAKELKELYERTKRIKKRKASDSTSIQEKVRCSQTLLRGDEGERVGGGQCEQVPDLPCEMTPRAGHGERGEAHKKTMSSEAAGLQSNPDIVEATVKGTRGTVVLRGRKVEGEIDTRMVILKSSNELEVTLFKDMVVNLSQSVTRSHPLIFTGPQEKLYICSRRDNVFIFQYAQLFEGCKPVSSWTELDSPGSRRGFLLQVFLTLRAALEVKMLPVHMTEWRHVLFSKGVVMIDVVSYLSFNFHKGAPTFGEKCPGLLALCSRMVAKHLPGSHLCSWIEGLGVETSARNLLNELTEQLRGSDHGTRTKPGLLSLKGNFFTFRDYLADAPNWLLQKADEEELKGACNAKILVYGAPRPFRGDQTAESLGDTKLKGLVRNIIMRLRFRVFGSCRVEATGLDCTKGFTEVTLNSYALAGISNVDRLKPSRLISGNESYFAHDAVSQTESKWAPVIMFTKFRKQGPVDELSVDYYSVSVLTVLLSPLGSVTSLRQLFQSVTTVSMTD